VDDFDLRPFGLSLCRRPRWKRRWCPSWIYHSGWLWSHHPHLQRNLHPERSHPRLVHPCPRGPRLASLRCFHGWLYSWRYWIRIRIWIRTTCLCRIRSKCLQYLLQEVNPRSSTHLSCSAEKTKPIRIIDVHHIFPNFSSFLSSEQS